jgi:ATP-binding cassette, subfamily B, bacterial
MPRPGLAGGWHTRARVARAAAEVVWSTSPALLGGLAVVSLAAGLVSPAVAWLQRDVLDALASHGGAAGPHLGLSSRDLLVLVLALGAAGVAAAVVPQGQQYVQEALRRTVRVAIYDRIYRAVASWPGIARFESPGFADKLQLTGQLAQSTASSMIGSALGSVQALITSVTFMATLVVINPVLAVVVAVIESLAIAAGLANAQRQAQLWVENSKRARRQQSFSTLFFNAVAAKEVRLFGLGAFLRGRILVELNAINSAERALGRRLLWVESALGGLSATVIAVGLVWIAAQVAAGHMPVGDVSLFVMAAMGMQGAMNQLATALGGMRQSVTMFGAYTDVVSAPPDLPVRDPALAVPALTNGIAVEDVWFRYDESHPWVLRGLSLFIPSGSHVALVGLNGSGKSTLVKLLCRMYDPARGSIRWDGVDIRDMEPSALRERIAAVFQDFVCYELTAAENIGVGDLSMLDDMRAIRGAAELAGADADISRLPQGYDTMLSRVFVSRSPESSEAVGAMLSGGQGQRLALARALMRADPDLLIVDEPMSNLDAEAEYAVNRRLAEVQAGRTCVLISHRLASVRESDQIIVISDGVVTEQGTHAELMAYGGRYAHLFSLQAAGYSDPAGADVTGPRMEAAR